MLTQSAPLFVFHSPKSSVPRWPLGPPIIFPTCARSYPFLPSVLRSLSDPFDFCSLQPVTAYLSRPPNTLISLPLFSFLLPFICSIRLYLLLSVSPCQSLAPTVRVLYGLVLLCRRTNFSPGRQSVIAPYIGRVIWTLGDHLWSC